MTETANRIGVRLGNNNHVPILCLHNSPAKVKGDCQVEMTLSTCSIRGFSTNGTVGLSSDYQDIQSGMNLYSLFVRAHLLQVRSEINCFAFSVFLKIESS